MNRAFIAAAWLGAAACAASAAASSIPWDRATDQASALARQARGQRVPNLRVVEDGLYRSGRPGRDAYGRLEALGVKTILNLEGARVAQHERRRAAAFPGIKVVNVPLSGWSQPSFGQLDRTLDVLASAPRPILVHCRHGEDRTGVVVAAYEAAVRGRPAAGAAREARALGCCHLVTNDLQSLLERYLAYRTGR